MYRRSAVILGLLMLLLGSLAGAVPDARAGTITLDPNVRIQPVLQYGAKADPKKVVRIIVQKYAANDADNVALAKLVNGKNVNSLGLINGFSMEVTQGTILPLGQDKRVKYVSFDGALKAKSLPAYALTPTTSTITPTPVSSGALKTTYPFSTGATEVWSGASVPQATGKGVNVALIDTGIYAQHPALVGYLNCAVVSPANSSTTTYKATVGCTDGSTLDGYGHGTHTAGIITGRSANGNYIGIAPNSTLTSVRIANALGQFTESDLLRGLQYVYDNRWTTGNPNGIRVLNLSVSTAIADSALVSPVDAAVERLWAAGVTVVVAAGNSGTAADAAWYAPGNDPVVITVGCSDEHGTTALADDTVCDFSSRGITQDGYAKPDLIAPGRQIVSTLAPSSKLANDPALVARIVDTSYFRLSGTSMSAPMVAGVAALLLERYPALTPDQLKALLVATTQPLATQPGGGPGFVRADRAMVAARDGQYPPTAGTATSARIATSATIATSTLLASYWDSGYWDSAYWDSGYWDSSYWDSSYWDAVNGK